MMNHLIVQYQHLLNLQNARFSLIEHEDAMVAIVYRVTLSSGRECILKICPRLGDYLRESYFLKCFENQIPVPHIIQLIEPNAAIHGAILMECLPGKLLNSADINDKLAYEIGSLLAKIHLIQTKGYGDLTQPEQLSSDPRIPFALKFEEGLDECKNHLPVSTINQSYTIFDRNIDLLTAADGPRIIHRDFRPGNLMVFNGQIQGVIDWSSGRGGFAEEDLCPIEFEEWSLNQSDKKALLAGYANIRSVPHCQELIPLLRLSKAIAVIGFTVKHGTWETRDAKIYQNHRYLLENFLKQL